MKTALLLALCATTLASAVPAIDMTPKSDAVRGKEIADMKWGMFVCWSFSTFSGMEWTPTKDKDASFFKATGCDTDQWCKAAKDAGMGYILFLTKHHDGFCLWDTATSDKKVTNSPLKRDVLAALRKSCDKYGIKLAIYFSEGDWNWPGAVDGAGGKGGSNPEMKKAQLKELLTRYGPVEFIWFDHAVGTGGLSHADTDKWVRQFQPNCFSGFNNGEAGGRIVLREKGKPGPIGGDGLNWNAAQGANEKKYPYTAAEFTYPILPHHGGAGAEWFYSVPALDSSCLPARKLYHDYLGAVKFGNIFSIDVGPDYAGKLREIDVKTLREVGQMIRGEIKVPIPLPGKATASTIWAQPGFESTKAIDGDPATRWGAADGSRSAWLEITLDTATPVSRALIDEAGFSRIQKFEIQAKLGAEWKTIAMGTAVGSDKEIEFTAPVTAQSFRLNLLEANEVPTIGEFQLFE
jgi:alpha-L-fucosidase